MKEDIYLFDEIIDDRKTGRTNYNRIFQFGSTTCDWPEDFANVDIYKEDKRRLSKNGTYLNNYPNNFEEYINLGIKTRIKSFLTESHASVCGKVWGYGGVGKTATVQSICEDLYNGEKRSFDYIVFASAKDREFNYTTNEIVDIDNPIASYRSLVACINETMGGQDDENTEEIEKKIIKYKGRDRRKLLIIIDDYETFSQEDKNKIRALISQLNTNNHKVLITTRAPVVIDIGEEFATDKLNPNETVAFLADVMKQKEHFSRVLYREGLNHNLSDPNLLSDLKPDIKKRIFDSTDGRPLFIFQFANVWMQMSLEEVFSENLKEGEARINFLYGRIFSCLTKEGQNIFRAIGHLVQPPELTSTVEKLRYIVNMEYGQAEKFDHCLDELTKWRTIEVFEKDNVKFFRVYSTATWQIMKKEYGDASPLFHSDINSRLRKTLWNDDLVTSLLEDAIKARSDGRAPNEVDAAFREILDWPDCSKNIKLQALRLLAGYYFRKQADPEMAIKTFNDYY